MYLFIYCYLILLYIYIYINNYIILCIIFICIFFIEVYLNYFLNKKIKIYLVIINRSYNIIKSFKDIFFNVRKLITINNLWNLSYFNNIHITYISLQIDIMSEYFQVILLCIDNIIYSIIYSII